MGEVIESYEHAAQPGRVRAMPALLARVDRTWLALAVLLVCVCAVHVGTLLRVPPASTDEGWNAARGLALLQTGQAYGTLDAGVFDRYVGYWTYFPLLGTAIHAAFIGVFGVSLFALRLASVAFGLLLVAEVYVIARTLYNPRAGLLAGFLVASSFPFLFSSHLGRHDIIAAAMGFGAIALCVTGDRGRFPAKSLLAGLLAGLTLDVHPNGLIYGPAVAALYVCDFRWAFFRSRRFWAFVAGGCIAVLYFVAIHILPYPQTYFELYRIGNGSGRTPPLLDLGGQALSSFVDFASDLLSWQLLPFVAALALLLFRRSASDVKLLVLLSTLTVGFAALIRNKEPHYGILIYPAISLVIAVLLLSLFDGARRASPLDFARPLVAWAILAISIAPVL